MEQIATIPKDDPLYPQRLMELPDHPAELYCLGNTAILTTDKAIAIVGTREPSEAGRKLAYDLGRLCSEQGWLVVSGLARGCDTGAHWGCVEQGRPTLAVLAHGLDMVFPPENAGLARAILESGGCLVSEYPCGVKPLKENFTARNRIQAALAQAVIVVESELEGSTMHTARFALELGRELACLVYDKVVPEARLEGNEHLVSSGKAVRLVTEQDIRGFLDKILSLYVFRSK